MLYQNKTKMIMFSLFLYLKNLHGWVLISSVLSTFVNETLRNSQDPILPPLKTLKMRVITPLSFLT